MSTRKEINKYYPVDFDPSKVKRVKRPKGALAQQTKVRIALPMTCECSSCGNWMARGSKFNARKETVTNEAYLGQAVYRFYFRCSKCFQELTIKTDPKNADYVAENGLKAGFVLHKAGEAADAAEAEEKERLEGFDKMKALEQKALESMAEAELNDAIDTVLFIQSKRAQLSAEELHRRALEALDPTLEELDEDEDLTEEDLAELEEMRQRVANRPVHHLTPSDIANGPIIRRLDDEDEQEEDIDPIALRTQQARERLRQQQAQNANGHNTPEENQVHSLPQATNALQTSESTPASSSSLQQPAAMSTTQKTLSSNPSSLFKAPIVKAVSSTSTSKSTIIVSTSGASSAPKAPVLSSSTPSIAGVLTNKKYSRRDDDE